MSRFTRRRKVRRPAPIDMLTANLMGSSFENHRPVRGAAKGRLIAKRAARAERPAVLAFTEAQLVDARDLNAAKVLAGYRFVEDPMPARRGLILGVDTDKARVVDGSVKWTLGTPDQIGRRRADSMRARWILSAHIVFGQSPNAIMHKVSVQHPPPKRNWLTFWPRMMNAIRKQDADVAAADWNKLARAVQAALGRKTRMVHIVGWAIRRAIPVSAARPINVGGDHPAVGITLWPTRSVRRKS